MTDAPHIHTIKSNARREARKRGLDPATCVHTAANGKGFYVQEPTKAAPYEARFGYTSYARAERAGLAQAKSIGLKPDAFVVATRVGDDGFARFAFVPKASAEQFTLATKPAEGAPASEGGERGPTFVAYPRKGKGKGKGKGAKPRAKAGEGQSLIAKVREMILREKGASVPDMMAATGWLAHTLRARISGLVKDGGLEIDRQRLLGVTFYIGREAGRKRKAA